MKLKSILLAVVLLTSVVATPAVAQSSSPFSDKLGPGLSEMKTFAGYDTTDSVLYHGNPGVYVTVSEGKLASLESWANASSNRRIVAVDNESNRALVSAPPADLLGGIRITEATIADRDLPWVSFGDGLVSRSYVSTLASDSNIDLINPVDSLATSESYAAPTGSSFISYNPFSSATFAADGQAWSEDANRATLAEAQEAIDADGTEYDGTGVRVAVIDSGLNVENAGDDPLYQNRITAPKNTITNETGVDAVATDVNHGPWVTAAIAANPNTSVRNEPMEGVAPNATIIPIKALNDEGGSTQDIAEAIQHASDNDADIISMSLGSPMYNPTLADEIEEFLANGGTAVVIAVGNSKTNPATRYISSPADVESVIGVAATNASAPEHARPAYFSEVGPDGGASDLSNGVTNGEGPDIAAPGMNLTAPISSTANLSLSGTSMATPLVSGVAALTLEANPGLRGDHEAFRTTLLDAARPIPNAGTTEVGNGMVSAANATAMTEVEVAQADARTDLARSRDLGNEAYSGSDAVRIWLSLTGGTAA